MVTAIAEPEKAIYFGVNVPKYLQVEVTSRCNLACKMCPLTMGSTLSSGTEGNLGDKTWDEVKQLAQITRKVLLSGFGEPMTNVRFPSMLRELDELGVETSFSTNAIGAEHLAPVLRDLRYLTHVNVSIDSPDSAIYREIRGGDLHRVMKGLRALAEALPGRVSVSSVAMVSNLESLRAFPAILQELGIRNYVIQPMIDWSPNLFAERLHTRDWGENVISAIREDCTARGMGLHVTEQTERELIDPVGAFKDYRLNDTPARRETRNCHIPYESLYMDSEGRVFPCCHSAGATSVFGNANETSLFEIFNGPVARKFREDLLHESTTPPVCRICNVASEGEHWFKLWRGRLVDLHQDGDRYRLTVQNLGTKTWGEDVQVRIGTEQPRDRFSAYQHESWLGPNRIADKIEPVVKPGEMATFRFQVNRVPTPLPEWFQIVIEMQAWLPETHFAL